MPVSLTDIARTIHAMAVGRLDYASDTDTAGRPDDWRSHAAALLAQPGARYRGDCDDCAFTAAELAVRLGIPAAEVRVVMVDTQQRGNPKLVDHMVCALGPADGAPLIIDNRAPDGPVRWDLLDYTWGDGMRASEPGVWRATVSS
ncbi:hypothetical protein [Niveispirillum sp. KHB5.9]|uniref:hypothetical protein n=1 Tax=Niveispirillum sp. KHB5.9 TaxID=3400269 RepID=UPI003A857A30